jgi:hypothetical protein
MCSVRSDVPLFPNATSHDDTFQFLDSFVFHHGLSNEKRKSTERRDAGGRTVDEAVADVGLLGFTCNREVVKQSSTRQQRDVPSDHSFPFSLSHSSPVS